MFKASIELIRIHKSCKVKFSLIIKDDNPNSFQKLVGKYTIGGNEYLNITPFPFLTIDITSRSDKKEGWSSNLSFNMNRRDLFFFIKRSRNLLQHFVTYKNLFFYNEESELTVNLSMSDQLKEVINCGNKLVRMQACVVESEEDKQKYEGIFLSINSMDYFTYLTYDEFQLLINELSRVDMTSLSMQLINTVYLTEKMESEQIALKQPVEELKEDEIVDKKVRITIDEPNTIPEI